MPCIWKLKVINWGNHKAQLLYSSFSRLTSLHPGWPGWEPGAGYILSVWGGCCCRKKGKCSPRSSILAVTRSPVKCPSPQLTKEKTWRGLDLPLVTQKMTSLSSEHSTGKGQTSASGLLIPVLRTERPERVLFTGKLRLLLNEAAG